MKAFVQLFFHLFFSPKKNFRYNVAKVKKMEPNQSSLDLIAWTERWTTELERDILIFERRIFLM